MKPGSTLKGLQHGPKSRTTSKLEDEVSDDKIEKFLIWAKKKLLKTIGFTISMGAQIALLLLLLGSNLLILVK